MLFRSVADVMARFSRAQSFIEGLLLKKWDQLAAISGRDPVFSQDGNKGIFWCFDNNEPYSPGYLIWKDRTTGQAKYLGVSSSDRYARNPHSGLFALSYYTDLTAFNINTGEAAAGGPRFDFGSRLMNGDPERVIRAIGYDGFADRYAVVWSRNPYGEQNLEQKLFLDVFDAGGEFQKSIDTGLVIRASYKNYPVTSRLDFTADGRAQADFLDQRLDLAYLK